MITKDTSVQCAFHPVLTPLLFGIDQVSRELWKRELTITSGSEPGARHSKHSFHYATPCQAADIRTWEDANTPSQRHQAIEMREVAAIYCDNLGIPHNWIEIIEESDHIHIEYQPKRTG